MRKLGYAILGLIMIVSVLPLSMAGAPSEAPRALSRTVLGELFTATWCGYCPAADNAFDNLLKNASYYPNRFVALEWHPTSGGDIYGGDDQNATISYYSISGYPTAVFDGTQKIVGGSTSANDPAVLAAYKGIIDARPSTSIFSISAECDLINDYIANVYVNVTATETPTNTSMKVRAVLAEDLGLSHNNGMLRWTARDTVINSALSINSGETKRFTGTGQVDFNWNVAKLSIVAYVQTDTTKEVLQATTEDSINRITNAPAQTTGPITNFNFAEDTVDTRIDLRDVFSDLEGNDITYGFVDGNKIKVGLAGSHVTLTPAKDWTGSETIKFTAKDTYQRQATNYDAQITVTAVNDQPTVKKNMLDFSMMENTQKASYDLDEVFGDIDSSLTYSYGENVHINVSIDKSTHVVTFTAPDLWVGKEKIRFTAGDGQYDVSTYINITVVHVNHQPTSKAVADITMEENGVDTSIDLTKVFMDLDGFETLAFTSENIGGHLTVTIDQAYKVTLKPAPYWNGREQVIFTASDSIAEPVSISVNVIVTAKNYAPELSGALEKIVMDEESSYSSTKSLKNCFRDPDGDALTYAADFEPASITVDINPDGTVTFTGMKDFFGVLKVTFHAADAGGLEALYNCNVTVENIDDAPVIRSMAPSASKTINMNEGETKTFNITAFSPDSDPLEYVWSVDGKEKGENSDTFDYAPDFSSAATHKVTVVVSDGKEIAELTWTVKVANVNRDPTASISSPLNMTSFGSGSQITFKAVGTDPDNDRLQYKWLSDGVEIGALPEFTRTLSSGTHVITLEVNDGTTTVTSTTTITVKKPAPAQSPGFEGVALMAGILAALALVLVKRRK